MLETIKLPIKVPRIPKRPGAIADLLYTTKQQRLALQKEVAKLAAYEKALKDYAIDNFPKSSMSSVSGKVGSLTIHKDELPIVEDQTKFRAWLNRTRKYEFAQSLKPSTALVKEVWEDGREIPGIGHLDQIKVSITKV